MDDVKKLEKLLEILIAEFGEDHFGVKDVKKMIEDKKNSVAEN